jgi:NADPH-dependent ferric siderophore reductase
MQVLLIADETALPAVAGILEQLAAWPAPPRAQVFIEVAEEADRLALPSWASLSLEWLVRGSRPYGAEMIAAAARADIPSSAFIGQRGEVLAEVDPDRDILWDRADQAGDDFYGWVAGETAAVSSIRTMLINDKGIDRRLMTLMGYWRYGKPHA